MVIKISMLAMAMFAFLANAHNLSVNDRPRREPAYAVLTLVGAMLVAYWVNDILQDIL